MQFLGLWAAWDTAGPHEIACNAVAGSIDQPAPVRQYGDMLDRLDSYKHQGESM
jgi:hypothetical protein